MKRRDFLKLSAGFGATGLGAAAALPPFSAARAESKTVFKAADVQPAGYPTVAATESLGKKLAAATSGRLSVQVYPSAQLGAEKETIEQTQIGAIQLLRVSAGAPQPSPDRMDPASAADEGAKRLTQAPAVDAKRGRHVLLQYGCVTCHEIPGVTGAAIPVGPPLDRMGSRRFIAGVLENTPDNMVRWLRTPQEFVPDGAMPNLGVAERDARDMAAYLESLR